MAAAISDKFITSDKKYYVNFYFNTINSGVERWAKGPFSIISGFKVYIR